MKPNFVWSQYAGTMTDVESGSVIGLGHAGHDAGRNNPDMEAVHAVGPLPKGFYYIEPERSDAVLGIVSMRLTPVPENIMYGRAGFFIHAPEFSEGCIVLQTPARCEIAEAVRKGRNILQVIA